MAKCTIYWDKQINAYRMKMNFNEKVVEFLKKQIPLSERKWDPENKIWTFTETFLDGTIQFAKLVFGATEVAVVTRAQVEASQTPPRSAVTRSATPLAADCMEFLKSIPYEAAREAYRRAARLLHPDVNKDGDIGDMSKVNALWQKIEKEIYGQ